MPIGMPLKLVFICHQFHKSNSSLSEHSPLILFCSSHLCSFAIFAESTSYFEACIHIICKNDLSCGLLATFTGARWGLFAHRPVTFTTFKLRLCHFSTKPLSVCFYACGKILLAWPTFIPDCRLYLLLSRSTEKWDTRAEEISMKLRHVLRPYADELILAC